MRGLHYREISQLAPQIRAGKLSPVELTEAFLGRIDALDPRLHAYARVTADAARAAARAAEARIRRGEYLGPLVMPRAINAGAEAR